MPSIAPEEFVHVAVGVIRAADGRVLLSKRRDDAHQGGLWEFPGGKVEPRESLLEALRRELHEELAIQVGRSEALIQIRHHYGDKSVLLDVWQVLEFSGEPQGNEGQPLEWVEVEQLRPGIDCPFPLPAANAPILKALKLPKFYAITGEFVSTDDFLHKLKQALQMGAGIVQLRAADSWQQLSAAEGKHLLTRAREECERYESKLLVNGNLPLDPKQAHGLHLTSKQLMATQVRPASVEIVGASCHNLEELLHADSLDLDYLLLSPVQATPSHPKAQALSWQQFQKLVEQVNTPVYALGGMQRSDLPQARACGAQGIAGISCFWMT